MRISVRVIPRSKRNEVIPQGDNRYRVYLTAPPVEGKANDKLVEVLAEYFHVRMRKITIIKGESAREKVIEIL